MPQIISTEPLAQILRSIALQERTGILRIEQLGERQAGRGELYFEKGRLTRAYCGQETGRTAVRQISAWKQITCAFHSISKPLPATTHILNPSRARTENKPPVRTQFAAVSRQTAHFKSGKNGPADTQEGLYEPETEAIPSARLHLNTSPAGGMQLPVLHGEEGEAGMPPTRGTRTLQHWPTHKEAALHHLPPTPHPTSLSGGTTLPGRTAIFKARSMVTTARAIQCMQRRERIIFILLDGRRTIQDIARLIHQPEAEVEQTLVHLTNSGYIQYIQG
jgi:hypothetical protein